MFYQTIYLSQPTNFFNALELYQLLRKSRKNNSVREVSGLLLYNKKYFLQYLEGAKEVVQPLVRKIDMDPRHKNMFVLSNGLIRERLFPHWTMGFSDAKTLTDLVDTPQLNIDFVPDDHQWSSNEEHSHVKDLIIRFHSWSLTDQTF